MTLMRRRARALGVTIALVLGVTAWSASAQLNSQARQALVCN